MYNRLGLSSDSGLGPLSVTKEQAADMLGGAMTLIPSLGRPRAGAAVAEPMGSERPAWRVIGAKMSPRVGWPMSDRLHLRPELPPPQPSRSEKAYFELSKATRGWEYGSVPPPCEKSKDWRSFSRRPPLTGPTDQSAVDSLQTRRSELRRLLSAADFLRRVVSPKSDLQICCNDIVRSCRKALSVPAGENTLLEDLRDIKRLILSNTEREFAWRMLNQRRQNLADVLDSESRETLWKVVNANQDILSLYGNNLFLAVFAAAEKATEGTASQLMAQLWSAVAEWQLYQMGFKPQKTPGQKFVSRYDYQAIYSNLLRRANGMKNLPRHKPVQMIQRYGQALWEEQEDGYNIWLVFPERTTGRLLGALVMGQESLDLRLSWYRCMIDPERLSQAAETAQKSWNRMPIIVASLEEQEFLWMKTQEEEGEGWSCMGMLEYGAPPEARTFPIRWFKLSEPSPEAYSAIQHLRPGPEPSGLSESVKRLLKEVKAWEGTAKDVKCVVLY